MMTLIIRDVRIVIKQGVESRKGGHHTCAFPNAEQLGPCSAQKCTIAGSVCERTRIAINGK